MKISILTLFPHMFEGPFKESIIKHAQEKKIVQINFVNIRDFGLGKHKVVDDTPYGGGQGMILRVDVLENALAATRETSLSQKVQKIFLLSARGEAYTHVLAQSLAKLKHLILICGHYEGVDQRIRHFIDGEISIGDFIVTGGEIPAMLIADSVTRLLPGVLKNGVTENESFSPLLEYPQYTKPALYRGYKVPKILLSGHHEHISQWREKEAVLHTRKVRPDLLKSGK